MGGERGERGIKGGREMRGLGDQRTETKGEERETRRGEEKKRIEGGREGMMDREGRIEAGREEGMEGRNGGKGKRKMNTKIQKREVGRRKKIERSWKKRQRKTNKQG